MAISILFLYSCIYLLILFLDKIYNPIKKLRKNRITKLDYYRDELNEYSPIILSLPIFKNI